MIPDRSELRIVFLKSNPHFKYWSNKKYPQVIIRILWFHIEVIL